MVKNGKVFLTPEQSDSDLKALFRRVIAAGAGRPLGDDGFPAGPWTPELLAGAISQIDANRVGVDLRTVQLWFQENDRGISRANIRWLARVLGCDDPAATGEWQVAISAAQSRLTARRRDLKQTGDAEGGSAVAAEGEETAGDEVSTEPMLVTAANGRQRFSLARTSEALFSRSAHLNLPALVFAGAAALGFLSSILGIHNTTYSIAGGPTKQVGFLWAPNWTFLFLVFMPAFFAIGVDTVSFWKETGRSKYMGQSDRTAVSNVWMRTVEAASYSFWAVLLICLVFAGLLQWIAVCVIPLIYVTQDYATDWASMAAVRPDLISVPEGVLFTFLAYGYMSICFYIFFAGLILLYIVIHDLWSAGAAAYSEAVEDQSEIRAIARKIMDGLFRCVVLGVLIAMAMKLQSAYLLSQEQNIILWLRNDALSYIYGRGVSNKVGAFRAPTHYSSLLVVVASCVVFLYASIRMGSGGRCYMPVWRMALCIIVLVLSYLLIGEIKGFSIVLFAGLLVATYGLFNPGFGRQRLTNLEDKQNVL